MLIAYGTACLLVILLAALHRPAAPYAFTLAAGWVLGFIRHRTGRIRHADRPPPVLSGHQFSPRWRPCLACKESRHG